MKFYGPTFHLQETLNNHLSHDRDPVPPSRQNFDSLQTSVNASLFERNIQIDARTPVTELIKGVLFNLRYGDSTQSISKRSLADAVDAQGKDEPLNVRLSAAIILSEGIQNAHQYRRHDTVQRSSSQMVVAALANG